jgi:serine phosphatase RsbU (regulator of sigma subunit)
MDRMDAQTLAGLLAAAENAAPVDAVEAVTRELGKAIGARTVSFMIADLGGRALVRLAYVPLDGSDGARRDGDEVATAVMFDGGPQEQAIRTQTVQVVSDAAGWTVLAPVTERGEMIGLLEVCLPDQPPAGVAGEIARAAHALAFVIIANRRHTDLFEWGQRSTPFTLSAEIQRRLLPGAFTCEAGAFTLAGWLEPAASVGGDTFDYSLSRDVLHFSVTDAMGHGVASALTACLCVGSLRNTRRQGADLLVQAAAADVAVGDHVAVRGSYVAAILGRLDLRTGVCELINAGHIPPLLVRDGQASAVPLPKNFPLGMFAPSDYRCGELALRPGDRLVVVTDGMREHNAAHLDLSAELISVADLHPREAVRVLADAVMAVAGPTLADDATTLVIDWYGGHAQPRQSSLGADQERASGLVPS